MIIECIKINTKSEMLKNTQSPFTFQTKIDNGVVLRMGPLNQKG